MKMIQGRLRVAVLMGAAVSVLAFTAGVKAQDRNSNDNSWQHDDHDQWSDGNSAPHDNPWPYNKVPQSPVLAVVGDISCQPGVETADESPAEVCTDASGYTSTSLWSSQEATAGQIELMKPDAVALLGDLQYQVGRYSDFEQSFDFTYGAFKFLQRPAPGNHEFYNEHGETGVAGYGYFSYYNGFLINTTTGTTASPITPGTAITATISNPCTVPSSSCKKASTQSPYAQPIPRADGQAGHFEESGGVETVTYASGPSNGMSAPTGVGDGWYSYNLGSWHLISLNIECYTQPDTAGADGCATGTDGWFQRELEWLKKDLDENHSACTLAYWHQPTFSATNGISEEGITAKAFWTMLYDHHADLVLNGHDHLYARYRPLDPDGNPDRERGIREFIVGTGGETLDPVVTTAVTSTEATSTNPETNSEDPSGNINFNGENLEAGTGGYWGVMALRLDSNGYHWHFKSAMEAPAGIVTANGHWPSPTTSATGSYSDEGFGTCHGSDNR